MPKLGHAKLYNNPLPQYTIKTQTLFLANTIQVEYTY